MKLKQYFLKNIPQAFINESEQFGNYLKQVNKFKRIWFSIRKKLDYIPEQLQYKVWLNH